MDPATEADLPRVIVFPPRPTDEPLAESAHMRAHLLAPGAPAPDDTDALIVLPDASRFAYVPRAPGGPAATLAPDPLARGNSFKPLHESERALVAQLSIAASRRLDTGPESERVFLFLRGRGLLSLENGDALRFEPNQLGIVPAGYSARLWAQGPEDVLAVVFQPRAPPSEKRTLAGEIAKRRAPTSG